MSKKAKISIGAGIGLIATILIIGSLFEFGFDIQAFIITWSIVGLVCGVLLALFLILYGMCEYSE